MECHPCFHLCIGYCRRLDALAAVKKFYLTRDALTINEVCVRHELQLQLFCHSPSTGSGCWPHTTQPNMCCANLLLRFSE